MATNETYSLPQFAAAAAVTPRTVRYYISEGLLPSPGAGPQARYTDEHLDRVRLIKELQRNHLPLAEIRTQLAGLTHDDVRRLIESHAPRQRPQTSALDYVRSVLAGTTARSTPPRSTPPPPAAAAGPPTPAQARAARVDAVASVSEDAEPMYTRLTHPVPAYHPGARPPQIQPQIQAQIQPDRSHWERIALDPDVELHIRRPLTRRQNRAVSRIIAAAREILEEDQP